jgi:cobalt-zinc-cadmium efflux system protein
MEIQKSKNLSLTLVANLALTIAQFVVGSFSGSLSLISDATHNSVDIVTLIIAWIGDKISLQKANSTHSYGYKRAGILASIVNSIILVGIAMFIFGSAVLRLRHPEPVQGGWVIAISILAIGVNGFSAYLMSKNKNDLNIKSAYLNMFWDTLASVGALLGGIIIVVTKLYWVDAVVSIIIGLLLIKGAVEILAEAIDILFEAVPKTIDIEELKTKILSHECVNRIVDLHIWSITSENIVLTAVIEINPTCLDHLDRDIEELKLDLKTKFGIYHQTIEARIQAVGHSD